MKKVSNIRIGVSGIRGIAGDTMTPFSAAVFTRAFATLTGKGKVAVAMDSRLTGEPLKDAVISALLYSGIVPVDLGIVPTPTLCLYVKEKRLRGGIIVTASHNTEEWNGLKFIDRDGLVLRPFHLKNLIDIYHQQVFAEPESNCFPSVEKPDSAFSIHMDKIFEHVDVEKIRSRQFKVLVDPVAGAATEFNKVFLESLGCKVEIINDKFKDKRFPRPPEPLKEHLGDISGKMAEGDYDVGFAQDPDGDRLSVLDEKGSAIGDEGTLALALYSWLRKTPGGRVVVNVSTSRLVEFVASCFGTEVIKSAIGEINVVESMIANSASAGGEGNGGVIIPAIHSCRDSFTGMALVLDMMAAENSTVSEVVSTFPDYRKKSAKVPFTTTGAYRVVSMLRDMYDYSSDIDGIRVDTEDYWFTVRPSNTEPVLRITVETLKSNPEVIIADIMDKISD